MTSRFVLWSGVDEWRAEAAQVELAPEGVRARGTQLGVDPVAYRLDYELDAPDRFITRALRLRAAGDGWSRRLELTRNPQGVWEAQRWEEGDAELDPAPLDAEGLSGALDCDLAFSPLTNLMPIRREQLNEGPGDAEFVMAWVTVPELSVHASGQRYEHVRLDGEGAVVRFVDLGLFEGFTAELELDRDGLVAFYPDLARRVEPAASS
jgi:uncharacterized protein